MQLIRMSIRWRCKKVMGSGLEPPQRDARPLSLPLPLSRRSTTAAPSTYPEQLAKMRSNEYRWLEK